MLSGIRGRLKVHITTLASKTVFAGWKNGERYIRVNALPVDGRANEAVVRLIATALKIAPSRLSLISGAASRDKLIAVDGYSSKAIVSALGGAADVLSPRSKGPGL
jgi:uncharacterized protein YggU (UPF0235/DUF167 family)